MEKSDILFSHSTKMKRNKLAEEVTVPIETVQSHESRIALKKPTRIILSSPNKYQGRISNYFSVILVFEKGSDGYVIFASEVSDSFTLISGR